MKKNNLFILFVWVGAICLFSACEDDNNNPSQAANTDIVTIDASSYSSWVYFSFEEGGIVEISDFASSLEWDLGFHRTDLRVNCGASGPGMGGSLATGETDFALITSAPETGYATNDFISIAVDVSTIPPLMETVPGDTVLSGWVTMKYGNMGPQYTYSDEIFIVKTADGKYAKVWLKDYFNEDSNSGHVTMKYSYQADGSTKLD